MRFLHSLALFAAAASAAVISTRGEEATSTSCGNEVPDDFLQIVAEMESRKSHAVRETKKKKCSSTSTPSQDITVYMHVISPNATDDYVTDSGIQRQFNMLKTEFAKHNFTLTNGGTTRTRNEDWAMGFNKTAFKKVLRKGKYTDINVWILKGLNAKGIVGFGTYPTKSHAEGTDNFYNDGIEVQRSTFPNEDNGDKSKGKTAIHEMGHWMGLMHIFQGGCTGKGDYVDDTPPQNGSSLLSCKTRYSCPGFGPDLTENYMNYSPAQCQTSFTPGQVQRMQKMWTEIRTK